MKRILPLLLCLCLALTLCACSTDTSGTESAPPQTTGCSHTYADATCTTPKTCSKCGETEGEAAGHTLTASCTVCGHVNEGYVDLLTGEWGFVSPENSSGEVVLTFLGFCNEEESFVNVAHESYIDPAILAADMETTVDELRKEYESNELIKNSMAKSIFITAGV